MTLETGAPKVTLRNAPSAPYDGAIAAARTCYAPRVITAAEITDRQRDTIGKLTFDAGHHTVYQHATFEFGLEQVSRQFVWTALHSYPFYNSEQQSQRYVKLGEPKAYVPPIDGEARAVFERAVVEAWESYARLSAILKDDTFAILKRLRNITPKASPDRLKALEKEAEKKAIETARYVIPLAAFTAMVHTISGITLYRLMRMAQASDTPHEAREVIGAMVDAVRRHDPAFVERVDVVGLDAEDVVERGFPAARAGADAFAERFDRSLDGKVAQLVDWSPNAEEVVADAVRSVFGADGDDLSTDDALDRLLNPARNPYRLDTIQVAYHSPLMRSLQHASYTFRKRLSHTADSQDQRHRMVPGSRPLMTLSDTVRPDYVTPRLIRAQPGRPGRVRGSDGAGVDREEPAARPGRADRVRPLRPAERQGGPLRRVGPPHRPAAQVDDAHLLQRAGRDLRGVDGGGGAGPRRPPPPGALHRSALRRPQRPGLAAVHRGQQVLRRARLARLSQRRAPAVAGSASSHAPGACWACVARHFRLWRH